MNQVKWTKVDTGYIGSIDRDPVYEIERAHGRYTATHIGSGAVIVRRVSLTVAKAECESMTARRDVPDTGDDNPDGMPCCPTCGKWECYGSDGVCCVCNPPYDETADPIDPPDGFYADGVDFRTYSGRYVIRYMGEKDTGAVYDVIDLQTPRTEDAYLACNVSLSDAFAVIRPADPIAPANPSLLPTCPVCDCPLDRADDGSPAFCPSCPVAGEADPLSDAELGIRRIPYCDYSDNDDDAAPVDGGFGDMTPEEKAFAADPTRDYTVEADDLVILPDALPVDEAPTAREMADASRQFQAENASMFAPLPAVLPDTISDPSGPDRMDDDGCHCGCQDCLGEAQATPAVPAFTPSEDAVQRVLGILRGVTLRRPSLSVLVCQNRKKDGSDPRMGFVPIKPTGKHVRTAQAIPVRPSQGARENDRKPAKRGRKLSRVDGMTKRERIFRFIASHPGCNNLQIRRALNVDGIAHMCRDECNSPQPRMRTCEPATPGARGREGKCFELTALGRKALQNGTIDSEAPGRHEWPNEE